MQEHRVEPNVTTYSSVINAYANKGHWAGAEDVLHRMEVKGLEPDVITYNSLLKVSPPPVINNLNLHFSHDVVYRRWIGIRSLCDMRLFLSCVGPVV